MSNKLVGFDITKIVDELGEDWEIVSIGSADYTNSPIPFLSIPTITNWPNQGDLVIANQLGEDGDLWLQQSIVDYEMVPPNYITMAIRTVPSETPYYIDSVDFVGGRPPRRPGT